MTYAEILSKLRTGATLTADEVAEFEKVSRPADRFNEVAQKKAELEAQIKTHEAKIAELTTAVSTAKQEVEDSFNQKFKEVLGQVETLSQENTTLKTYKTATERLTKVREIAESVAKTTVAATFKDADYLDTLFSRKGIDITNQEQVTTALKELKAEKPEMFYTTVTPGSGTGANPPNGGISQVTQKPVSAWSGNEKAAYIKEHGADKFVALCKEQQTVTPPVQQPPVQGVRTLN